MGYVVYCDTVTKCCFTSCNTRISDQLEVKMISRTNKFMG